MSLGCFVFSNVCIGIGPNNSGLVRHKIVVIMIIIIYTIYSRERERKYFCIVLVSVLLYPKAVEPVLKGILLIEK